MPYIHQLSDDEAEGEAKIEFDKARARAGRVWNIVRIMGLNAPVMKHSMRHYGAAMQGPSPVSRVEREMLATVVSRINHCLY